MLGFLCRISVQLALPLLLFVLTSLPTSAQSIHSRFGVQFKYDAYASLLDKHVGTDGRVDYAAIKANPADLEAFIVELMGLYTDEYDSWDDAAKTAFWINCFNAYCIRSVVNHYPLPPGTPLEKLPGVFDKNLHVVKGEQYTLNQMLNEQLLANLKNPKIHFAVVAGQTGIAALANQPYTGEALGDQLDARIKAFVSNPELFAINHQDKTIQLPAVLQKLAGDFLALFEADAPFEWGEPEEKALIHCLLPYLSLSDSESLKSDKYKVVYAPIQTDLNEKH